MKDSDWRVRIAWRQDLYNAGLAKYIAQFETVAENHNDLKKEVDTFLESMNHDADLLAKEDDER